MTWTLEEIRGAVNEGITGAGPDCAICGVRALAQGLVDHYRSQHPVEVRAMERVALRFTRTRCGGPRAATKAHGDPSRDKP